ncbi:hypothetical protein TeGR_g15257 [Tetraparma gracilis]|uniref:Uncharacterized protein n=1 Tax=Tetraparma gracilis TaxID=2962635 RepID=A0ABQ6MLM3_9STRA|nr:hypothetical protein TeGR_g15257 [Tetraparma gracilis]
MPINAIKSVLKGVRSATKIGIDDGPKVHSGEELDAMLEDVRAVFAHAAQDLIVKLADVDQNMLLARSVETGVAEDDDLFGAGLLVVTSELGRKEKEEQKKKVEKVDRMESKRKAVEGDELLKGIAAAGKKDYEEYEERQLDMDLHNFLDFGKVKFAILLTLPNLFTYFVLMLLVVGIFALYDAYEHPGWKVAVTILALGIKVGGNKALLGLLGGGMVMWAVDGELYMYELGTALILRILQLSIPDQNTAQLVCLFGAVAEVSVRVFFYVNFLKGGLKNKTMTTEQLKKYALWGKTRVQDGSNDMVVEYMSSLIAGFFMIQLAPTGVFSFATDTTVSSNTILTLMSYQLIPELFLDFFVTFTEVFGGLGKLHASYWSVKTGSAPDSKYWAFRMGDLFKTVLNKLALTWFLTAFVLLVVIRS